MGLLRVAPDMVRLEGRPVGGSQPYRMVAEGRRDRAGRPAAVHRHVGGGQSARRHRPCRARRAPGGWTLETVFDLFPMLKEMRATPVQSLSGGQQQMVAIGRALLNQPRVLLCDEISLGLAPKVVREIYQSIPSISQRGTAIILVEQDVGLARSASDRLYCMLEGRVTLTGKSAEITPRSHRRGLFRGVACSGLTG